VFAGVATHREGNDFLLKCPGRASSCRQFRKGPARADYGQMTEPPGSRFARVSQPALRCGIFPTRNTSTAALHRLTFPFVHQARSFPPSRRMPSAVAPTEPEHPKSVNCRAHQLRRMSGSFLRAPFYVPADGTTLGKSGSLPSDVAAPVRTNSTSAGRSSDRRHLSRRFDVRFHSSRFSIRSLSARSTTPFSSRVNLIFATLQDRCGHIAHSRE